MVKIKKSITILLVFTLLFVFTVQTSAQGYPSLNNFVKIQTFGDNQFTDVSKDAWYYNNVKQAYELGLMKGRSDTFFTQMVM